MKTKKLSRTKNHRNAMLKNLASAIILYEKVKTTEAKAKAVKPIIEKMINLGKRKNQTANRKLYQYFPDKNAAQKIIEELVKTLADRKSGYLKITRVRFRAGDSAPQVLVELILPHKAVSTETAVKVATKTKVKTRVKTNLKEKLIKKELPEKKITALKDRKIKSKEESPKSAKSWFNKVSDSRVGKSISEATKRIWKKRTTQK